MNRVLSKVRLFVAIIALFKLAELQPSVFADTSRETALFDLGENITPKLAQISLDSTLGEKRSKSSEPSSKKSSSKSRKPYDELTTKEKTNSQSASKTKHSTSKSSGNPTPKHVPEKIPALEPSPSATVLERYSPVISELDSSKVPEQEPGKVPESAPKGHESAPERRSAPKTLYDDSIEESLRPVNLKRTASEEEFVERNGRSDSGKKLSFTLQIPTENSGAPETFICSPISTVQSPPEFIEERTPNGSPYTRGAPEGCSEFSAPEVPVQEFRNPSYGSLREDPVVSEVVAKLKSAILSFEDQMKHTNVGANYAGSEKEAEQKITRKFWRFVQKFLGLQEPESYQPVANTGSFNFGPQRAEISSLPLVPVSAPVTPEPTYALPISQPPVAYPEKPRNFEAMPFAYPDNSRSFEAVFSPATTIKSGQGAAHLAYPENSRHEQSYPLSQNQHTRSPDDLTDFYGLSNVPRVIQAADLTKFFPSTTQTQRIVESVDPVSEVQWRKQDPNSPQWSVNPSQKPNQFRVSIPYGAPQDNHQSVIQYRIPDFEHDLRSEVPETTTYPSVRAASRKNDRPAEPVEIDNRFYQKQSRSRQRTHRNRKEPVRVAVPEPECGPVEYQPEPVFNMAPNVEPEPVFSMAPIEPEPVFHVESPPVFHAVPDYEPVIPEPTGQKQLSIQYNFPGFPSTKVSIPTSPDAQHSTMVVNSGSPDAPAQVLVERVNASKFVVKHEEPYVINYQSAPYIVDFVHPPQG